MSNPLFQQLETKIDQAIETIEALRAQIEESESKNAALQADNSALKARQGQWENNLATLLRKLEGADISSALEEHTIDVFSREESEA